VHIVNHFNLSVINNIVSEAFAYRQVSGDFQYCMLYLIIIIIFIYCNWVVTRCDSGYFTCTRSVRKVSDRIFLCEHLMDYNLARLHEPTLNLSAHA